MNNAIVATATPSSVPSEVAILAGQDPQYLKFALGSDLYAISILEIREIIEYADPTPVPMMPRFIRGVINLRGAVVPVIDLALGLGGEAAQITKRACIVIIEDTDVHGECCQMGIIVDSVSEVVEIARADIEPPPAFGAKIRTDFVSGMARMASGFLIVLDAARIFAFEEILKLD